MCVVLRLQFTYEDGTTRTESSGEGTKAEDECNFEIGEYITEITTFTHLWNGLYPVNGGLKFTTNWNNTCGPYGYFKAGSPTEIVRGNALLYITGRRGTAFDGIRWVFDRC